MTALRVLCAGVVGSCAGVLFVDAGESTKDWIALVVLIVSLAAFGVASALDALRTAAR